MKALLCALLLLSIGCYKCVDKQCSNLPKDPTDPTDPTASEVRTADAGQAR
jgi:hypothetical protein